MRSNKELADTVVRRAAEKAKRRKTAYITLAAAACLVLVAGVSFAVSSVLSGAPPVSGSPGLPGGASGTLIAGSAAGGFVIVAVAAFALGICFTLLCLRLKGKK